MKGFCDVPYLTVCGNTYSVYARPMKADLPKERELLETCVCNKVRTAARVVTNAYDKVLHPVRLRATQLAVLASVGTGGSVSITALARLLSMDRSTLSRNLGPLENDGLVKIGNEGWRRSRTLEITAKGKSRLNKAVPLWKKAQQTLRRKLGNKEWANISASLDQLSNAG